MLMPLLYNFHYLIPNAKYYFTIHHFCVPNFHQWMYEANRQNAAFVGGEWFMLGVSFEYISCFVVVVVVTAWIDEK